MAGRTHRAFAPTGYRWHVSYETYVFMRREVERLQAEVDRLTVDRDHWYAKANYTDEELAEMYHRASKGLDDDGAWLWPDSVRTTRSAAVMESSFPKG